MKLSKSFLTVLLGLSVVPFSQASLILQGATDNYVAWEAEIGNITDPDGDNATWFEINDAGASAGKALQADASPGTGDKATDEGLVTYKLKFSMADDYNLFIRVRSVDTGGAGLSDNDSLYIPDKTNNNGFGVVPDEGKSLATATYQWFDTTAEGRYTVGVLDIGNVLEFSVGIREEGFVIDRFVLFKRFEAQPDSDALDRLENSQIPEPATLALMGLGLAGIGYQRRRKQT